MKKNEWFLWDIHCFGGIFWVADTIAEQSCIFLMFAEKNCMPRTLLHDFSAKIDTMSSSLCLMTPGWGLLSLLILAACNRVGRFWS